MILAKTNYLVKPFLVKFHARGVHVESEGKNRFHIHTTQNKIRTASSEAGRSHFGTRYRQLTDVKDLSGFGGFVSLTESDLPRAGMKKDVR